MAHVGNHIPLERVPSFLSEDDSKLSGVGGQGVAMIRLDGLSTGSGAAARRSNRTVTDLTSVQAQFRTSHASAGSIDEAEEGESTRLLSLDDISDEGEYAEVSRNEPITLTDAEKNAKLSKSEEDDLAKYRDRYANWGSVWGATIGAAIGAVGGSFIPGLGTVAGAGAGAALGLAIGRAVGWIVGNLKGNRAILEQRLNDKMGLARKAEEELPTERQRGRAGGGGKRKSIRGKGFARAANWVYVGPSGSGNKIAAVKRRLSAQAEGSLGQRPPLRRQSTHGASAVGALGLMSALSPHM